MRLRLSLTAALLVAPGLSAGVGGPPAGAQGPAERPFSLVARRYAFSPARLEVRQGDLVKVELRTADIAHSFTVDDYRISKRVSPGQVVTFEFRAERAGTFRFYCDLKTEDGCREMHGELVVRPIGH
jgi:heme/copper-type cytochrome/quinol oxidase subunit 2